MFQTHGFNEKEFLTDGAFPTAMAARPMAARGMLVLQVREIPISPSVMSSPQEVETMREGYVAAIEQLDAEGLIDPHKVGIIGFSRTGWYVLNTLLHATKYFAAATLAECSYISFGEYLMNADYSGRCARRPRNWAGAKLRSAAYGERIVVTVSRQLVVDYGRGYSEKNLRRMVQFAELFPEQEIVATLSRQLSWSHFSALLPLSQPFQREFYAEMARIEGWSVRTLRARIDSMLYERTALSKQPDAMIRQELAILRSKGDLTPALLLKDPYVLDFLGLTDRFLERDLEDAILRELETFLLERARAFPSSPGKSESSSTATTFTSTSCSTTANSDGWSWWN